MDEASSGPPPGKLRSDPASWYHPGCCRATVEAPRLDVPPEKRSSAMPSPLPMPLSPHSYAALSAMITPAIFLTAAGSLIISTSNRMSRIVDRIRTLNDLGDSIDRGDTKLDYLAERLTHLDDQVIRLQWRSDRIRHTLSMLYIAFAAFVGASLTLAVDAIFTGERHLIASVSTALSVAGVGLLLLASINLVREARAALASNRREIHFYRDLRARRVLDAAAAATASPG